MKSIFRRLGFSSSEEEDIKSLAKVTRDSVKNRILQRKLRTGFETRHIFIYDPNGMSPKMIAESNPIDTLEEMEELYEELRAALDLPYCCEVHRTKYGKNLADFFSQLEDDPTDSFDLFAGSEDEEFDLFADEEDFEFDLD